MDSDRLTSNPPATNILTRAEEFPNGKGPDAERVETKDSPRMLKQDEPPFPRHPDKLCHQARRTVCSLDCAFMHPTAEPNQQPVLL